jgi:hypothetical protein
MSSEVVTATELQAGDVIESTITASGEHRLREPFPVAQVNRCGAEVGVLTDGGHAHLQPTDRLRINRETD